jgi:hypothetical protein
VSAQNPLAGLHSSNRSALPATCAAPLQAPFARPIRPRGCGACRKARTICGFDQPGKQFDSLSVLRPAAILTGHGARITNALFSPDDRTIITASQDGWVRGWVLGADAETTAIVLPQPERSSASGRLRLRPQTGENLRLSQRPFSLVRLG